MHLFSRLEFLELVRTCINFVALGDSPLFSAPMANNCDDRHFILQEHGHGNVYWPPINDPLPLAAGAVLPPCVNNRPCAIRRNGHVNHGLPDDTHPNPYSTCDTCHTQAKRIMNCDASVPGFPVHRWGTDSVFRNIS